MIYCGGGSTCFYNSPCFTWLTDAPSFRQARLIRELVWPLYGAVTFIHQRSGQFHGMRQPRAADWRLPGLQGACVADVWPGVALWCMRECVTKPAVCTHHASPSHLTKHTLTSKPAIGFQWVVGFWVSHEGNHFQSTWNQFKRFFQLNLFKNRLFF